MTTIDGKLVTYKCLSTAPPIWEAVIPGDNGTPWRAYGQTQGEAGIAVMNRYSMLAPVKAMEPVKTSVGGNDFRSLREYVQDKANVPPVTTGVAAGMEYIQRTYGDQEPSYRQYRDLPQEFWYFLRSKQKIRAIKSLREVTGLSLKSSKDIVDKIIDSMTPPVYAFGFKAEAQPLGTVIRFSGDKPTTDLPMAGYVWERLSVDEWMTTGDEIPVSDKRMDALVQKHGYEIVHLPKGA